MKKHVKNIVSGLLILSLFMGCSFTQTAKAKVGDVVGTAVHTDIVAYINHYAIPSYAANGQSCIVAEDLRNFGFDVIWDEASRSLNIWRNSNTSVSEMTVTKLEKSGTFFSNILETDIKVFANGSQLTSYALNGYTMIPIEELNVFGPVYWVPEERAIKLWIFNLSERTSKQIPEKSKIGAPIGVNFCVDGLGFYTNSADGIKVYWQGKNNTGKTINYYTTYYSLYNPVGDPANCQIKKTNKISIKTVGPVYPGGVLIDYSVIAYSSVCEYIYLDRIFVEYSDGSAEWIEYGYMGGETVWDKYNNPRMGLSIYK